MSEYNLVVDGDLVLSTSEVDGSAIVGGSILGGTSNYGVQGVTASDHSALAVGGSVASGVTLNINGGGDFRISDPASQFGTVNVNGGTTVVDPGIASRVTGYMDEARSMSALLSALPVTGTIDAAGNFSSPTTLSLDGFSVAVYEVSQGLFDSGLGQFNLNMGAADTVIINYSSSNGIADLGAPPNLVGAFNQANSGRILWNFGDVTDITINNNFNGAILAPDASLSLEGGGINGAVVVREVMTQQAEIRLNLYTGYVPTPGAACCLFVVAAVGHSRRRR
ncbi:MAG: hypothetical protein Tsb0013_21830 [Phycisphaerales bacterium]